MSNDPKSHRFPSWFKKRQHPSEPADGRSQASTPPASNNQIIGSATAHERMNNKAHGSLVGLRSGALATTAPAFLLPGGTLQDDTTEQRTSSRDKLLRLFRRSPSPRHHNQSSTSQSKHPMPTTPIQTSTNDSRPSLSPPAEVNINSQRVMGNVLATGNDDPSVHTQQEPGSSVPSVPAESVPRRSDGDLKKTIIGTTKLLLETAAAGLKFAPIPNLDQIPNTLLRFIQIYENVSGNTEDLNQLCIVIQQAQESVVGPLQKWTGETPPELETLVQEFRIALQTQVEDIELVQKKHVVKRTIQAPDITQQITNMKSCLNDSIRRFQLRISTLTLLRTERLSIHSELSRLKRAPAEHTCVTSKSECLPGTRVKIQESLIKHLREGENRFVWLRGSPGTGKTAISMSVASTFEKEGTLAASYFWDKNQTGSGLDSIELFPTTLARQLASFNEDFKFSLVKHLRRPALDSVQHFPLQRQINTLIIEPMRDLKDIWSLGKDRVVIVLDGLDECGDQERLESLMELVLAFQELPPIFSVLVSCRPEPGVISAWDKARAKGHVILCEDLDKVVVEETFQTVRCMVEEGLQHLFDKYSWRPEEEELDAFAWACRGLPIMASIRVRYVYQQSRHGRTLQLVFKDLLNHHKLPANLKEEYLRILRQAYMPDSSEIHPDVAEKYHLVVGVIVAAHEPMNVSFMSQLFNIGEDEIRATLEPISSIVNLPLENTEDVTLYHATAKEFIVGEPIGDKKDKVFFIDDVKGYFMGVPLLRLFINYCEQDAFGIPTNPPLGGKRIWKEFMEKKEVHRWRFSYFIKHLLDHLDPSQLFSQESNELQNEFNSFITQQYVLTFMHLQNDYGTFGLFPDELFQSSNHNSIQLLRCLDELASTAAAAPWRLYRSKLPFTPPSSPLYKQYGHLTDPVWIFSTFGEFSGSTIPLSKDLLRAQAKLSELQEVDEWGDKVINYEAEFHEPDVRNGTVTCAALSFDGRYVALGFGSGIIEVADIDHQLTICRLQHSPANLPAWIEFVHGSHRVATEDNDGNVMILGDGMTPVNLGTLPTGPYPAGTTASDNGLFVVRVPRNLNNPWYDNMMLISVSEVPSIQPLASPPFSPSSQFDNEKLSIPHRRTLGFSPGGRYVGAFDGTQAITWSTESCQCIAGYRVTNFVCWIINPNVPPTPSYPIPDPIFTRATLPLAEGDTTCVHHSDAHDESDESWIKRPFYDLSPSNSGKRVPLCNLPIASRTPLIDYSSFHLSLWLNGRDELMLPTNYQPINSQRAWYGHRVPYDPLRLYRPQSSRDGTRFLVQGYSRAPIVVDISQVVSNPQNFQTQ